MTTFERARAANILMLIRDAIMSVAPLPAPEAGRTGLLRFRRGVRLRLPQRNLFSGVTFERNAYGVRVDWGPGGVYVEPLLEHGLAPVAGFGRVKVYSAIHALLMLAYNATITSKVLSWVGVGEGVISAYKSLARIVADWYVSRRRDGVVRPTSHIYAVGVEAGDYRLPSGTRCDVLKLVGYVDPESPTGYGILLECDGRPIALTSRFAEALPADLFAELAEAAWRDLEALYGLLDALRAQAYEG